MSDREQFQRWWNMRYNGYSEGFGACEAWISSAQVAQDKIDELQELLVKVERRNVELQEKAFSKLDKITALEARNKMLSEALLCLLYTSPSPRDLSTSRMPSSA